MGGQFPNLNEVKLILDVEAPQRFRARLRKESQELRLQLFMELRVGGIGRRELELAIRPFKEAGIEASFNSGTSAGCVHTT
ncbi:Uu.00g012770.m01.CDS01 [Anthostomella pinea]|uniref:Uu.00g012770.m01.CDS01 n=1 Tax=Anthostomella pinea TaxID=933095 RepID=A0AAI8YQ65_9PEZI|nr:Uu.00g012770.m01.CDS01 [Anthostomella pinea]